MASYKKRTQRKNGGRKRYASHSRRVKYGGVKPEDMDIETGISDLQSAEEGRSQTPPPPTEMDLQEESQSEYNPDAEQMVGGKRRTNRHFKKGMSSKTRKGRKDFVTHKGDKFFNRKGHRQSKSQEKKKSFMARLFGM
jgi:hypothetical protein